MPLHFHWHHSSRWSARDLFWLRCYQEQPWLQRKPLLLLLLMYYTELTNWCDEHIQSCCQLVSTEAWLGMLELPYSLAVNQVLDTVNQLEHVDQLVSYTHYEQQVLYQFFQHGACEQLVGQVILPNVGQYIELGKLFAQYPHLITARFVRRSYRHGFDADWMILHLDRIYHLAKLLVIDDIDKKIRRCRHQKDLSALQQRIEGGVSQTIVEILTHTPCQTAKQVLATVGYLLDRYNFRQVETYWTDQYPAIPIPDTQHCIQLNSFSSLFIESHAQHHCGLTYRSDIAEGEYALFKVLAPERATLGVKWNPKTRRYQFDQLVGKDNAKVAMATRRQIKRWVQASQTSSALIHINNTAAQSADVIG